MELDQDDYLMLNQFRLERMRSQVKELQLAMLHVDHEARTLNIHCTNPGQVDELMEMADLAAIAWEVLGCWVVEIWFELEAVWTEQSLLPDGFELPRLSTEELELLAIEAFEEIDMPTATLDKPAVIEKPASTASTALPGQSLSNIASDLEMDVAELLSWVLQQNAVVIPYNNEDIVSGETAIAAYQHWEASVVRRRMERRGLTVTSTAPVENGAAPKAATPTRKKPAAKKPARKTTARKTTARKPQAKASQTEG
ncbi:hypothetical protein ACQ4M4_13015 [Leptolyngbya sp. AN02str]|uniref:hypothetical protein n=1 Tax=Leptolyngbya sp. AN02str TaxID=3423363 RepID=UPI003D31F859